MNETTCTGSTDSPIRLNVPDLSRVPLAVIPSLSVVKAPVDFASAI